MIDREKGLKNLACAVIEQAVTEARMNVPDGEKYKNMRKDRDDAIHFIKSDRLDKYIERTHLNLNPEYIRRAI
jgi:hypothetical protein